MGACHALKPHDFLLTHHRGHGHIITKGADIGRMFAKLMCKEDGYCQRIGGSMHIADFDRNILGTNGIVRAGMGLGTGAAHVRAYCAPSPLPHRAVRAVR